MVLDTYRYREVHVHRLTLQRFVPDVIILFAIAFLTGLQTRAKVAHLRSIRCFQDM